MFQRPILSYRNLGLLALGLGALSHAQAEGTSVAALVNATNRNFRIKIMTTHPANASVEAQNLATKAKVLAMGTGGVTQTEALLGPGDVVEFTSRPGFNVLQTVDLTVREEGTGSAAGPGPTGVFRYWSWESENARGQLITGGARTWDPAGSTAFSFEHPSGGRAARIVLGPAKPAAPASAATAPQGLLPEPEGHAERDVPQAVAEAIRMMDAHMFMGSAVPAPTPTQPSPAVAPAVAAPAPAPPPAPGTLPEPGI